jgi:hypothetical protein
MGGEGGTAMAYFGGSSGTIGKASVVAVIVLGGLTHYIGINGLADIQG